MIHGEMADGVAILTLSKPPANTFDTEGLEDLDRALDWAEREGAGAILLRNDGPIFSAGADIDMIRRYIAGGEGGRGLAEFGRRFQVVLQRLESLAIPTVASICGHATGGGLELALACDLRIAAEDVKIGLPEVQLGLLPGAGGTQRLPRIAGYGTAARLILTGELITGAEASTLGVVQHSRPRALADAEACTLAKQLAGHPRSAVEEAKLCLAMGPSDQGYEQEVRATERLLGMDETRMLVAAFLERPVPETSVAGDSDD